MVEKVVLTYHLPTLGYISGTLHDESAQIYRALEASHEIRRIKDNPHLGAVSLAWEGVRHSRWDYVTLLIYLIQFAKEQTSLRLNSAVRLDNGTELSSTLELLNAWAMLLQTGHLYWTFAAERILLEEIVDKNEYIDELLSAISSERAREWAEGVVKHGDYYAFNRVLAYYRLSRIVKDSDVQNVSESILDAYNLPTSKPGLQYAKRLFNRIRRIAYLSLDAEYTPSAVSLRLDRILRDPKAFERAVEPGNAREDELVGLEAYLVRYVYLGREVLREVARRENSIRRRLEPALSDDNIRYIVEELAKADFTKAAKCDNYLVDVVRFSLDATLFQRVSPNVLNGNIQKRRAYGWAKRHGVYFHLAYELDAQSRIVLFQAHAKRNDFISGVAALSYAIRYINKIGRGAIKLFPKQVGPILVQQPNLLGEALEAVVIAVLERLFGREVYWEWGEEVAGIRVLWLPGWDRRDVVKRLVELVGLSPSRLHEIESTVASARGLRFEPAILAVSNLTAFGMGEPIPLLELDGVAITRDQKRDELVLTMVEAKDRMHRGESKSRKALSKNTRILQCRAEASVGRIRSRSIGQKAWAWRHFRLSYSAI